jgi:hypothetical protein
MPSDKRTRALAMVRRLHAEGARGGGFSRLKWASLDVIVKQASEVDVLSYAVDQGWIALAPGGHSVRVTAKGARAIVPGEGG